MQLSHAQLALLWGACKSAMAQSLRAFGCRACVSVAGPSALLPDNHDKGVCVPLRRQARSRPFFWAAKPDRLLPTDCCGLPCMIERHPCMSAEREWLLRKGTGAALRRAGPAARRPPQMLCAALAGIHQHLDKAAAGCPTRASASLARCHPNTEYRAKALR